MVRVVEDLMLALAQTFDTFVELVKGDVEVPRVTSSRFKSQPGGTDDAGLHEREAAEADERRLLRHLVESHAANGKDRDAVDPVDFVVALRVSTEDLRVKSPPRTTTSSSSLRTSPPRTYRSFAAPVLRARP